MQIQRIGFSPVKGGRHVEHASVDLRADGPFEDRVFSLVDVERQRVLKTVENPALLRAVSEWSDDVLSVALDGETIAATPLPTGRLLELDYWGRPANVELVDGPWASAFSAMLGREVTLARAIRPGETVYGAAITLITTGSLDLLAQKLGHPVDSRRFRANLVIETDDSHLEDTWQDRELRLGDARVRVMGAVDRCAVIDFDADSGASGSRLLKTLAGYRLRGGDIDFGMYAEVIEPAVVHRGDRVAVL
ncbi:hypothetical protein BH09ACT1_BH09ACT1_13980 [soil metagenome]